MRKYANKLMEELAGELRSGLLRLRKSYVDAAEGLVRICQAGRTYPYDFVVFRLTGFRPVRRDVPPEQMPGRSLRSDLLRLMLDVCDGFELRTGDYNEQAYDLSSLAKKFSVSSKTIQRWRRRGLPTRRLVFPDGRRRLAVLESSVQWFVRTRRKQVMRSVNFTHMTASERAEIIRRARRMANFAQCSLNEVAKRLSAWTGRSVETIRHTIRKHDADHPSSSVFPRPSKPLTEKEREVIYRCFLRGVGVQALAKRYERTRGSIYRIVNEMRAKQLLERSIPYVYNPRFDHADADEVILHDEQDDRGSEKKALRPPPSLPPYLQSLYEVPLLDVKEEQKLFRLYNYLKYKADMLRKAIDVNRIRTSELKRVEMLLVRANVVKNRIVRANLRLVVSIAKRHVKGPQNLFELVSDGNVSLMNAVEKFDYARGNRFSTYASWAIMRNFARSVPKERYLLDRFSTAYEEVLDIAAALKSYDPNELNIPELRESIDAVLAQLTPRERRILIDHYGLDSAGRSQTFDQLGKRLGISKERVRQIEIKALGKLRRILDPEEVDLFS